MHETKNQVVAEFIEILNRKHLEEELHQYISRYAQLMFDRAEVYSKLKLGVDYVIDFATCRPYNPGFEWVLIEIERGSDLLFTKSGDPTSKLVHSLKQVLRWRELVLENRNYIRRTLRGVWNPKCQVIIGERHTLSESNKTLLRQMNDDYAGKIEIVTFDYLVDNFKKYPKSLFEKAVDDPKIFSAFDSNVKKTPEEQRRLDLARRVGFDYE